MWSLMQRLIGTDQAGQPTDLTDPRFPKAWCVLALLYTCVWADGEVQEEEDIEVDALLTRARTFVPVTQEQVEDYIADLDEQMKGANSVYGLADFAIEHLPIQPGLALSLFAHCADLIHADRVVQRSEQEFLNHIGAALRLSDQDRQDVMDVMSWKHEMFTEDGYEPESPDPDQPWTRRRCMYVLYYAAALADKEFTYDEAIALAALVARARSLQGMPDELADDIRGDLLRAQSKGQIQLHIEQALRDLPQDERFALTVYANCADIIRADRVIRSSERRFMDLVARELKLNKTRRDLIDRVLDAKNRH
jgi:uncharacterized tellurite resistance protein B-like protein